jgi:hypothetical protein
MWPAIVQALRHLINPWTSQSCTVSIIWLTFTSSLSGSHSLCYVQHTVRREMFALILFCNFNLQLLLCARGTRDPNVQFSLFIPVSYGTD